ncbi:MAG: hypothetical protein DF168_00967 [Candidatus Moanabacter tarae]|uniref:Xylose isomerase-like TIM barrel domain-containing protein n=1 Tax=Candidatus Moanibacter tarae TaxID=2200854 RepID=A0A2Z4APR9_9BACT|nr:MAG: hypothetical protein DF168_00967 [Candidatus Moanabacter tarae]
MRLGGPIFKPYDDAESWAHAVRTSGYRAAYCPLELVENGSPSECLKLVDAAKKLDIVIAEVPAWSNPISRDERVRRKAIELCQRRLELAERVGANCCINLAGSNGESKSEPHPENLNSDTFDRIVESVREIIDAVKPKRTSYVLEMSPWVHPTSPNSYLRFINKIKREGFAAHLDPVNVVSTIHRFYYNAAFLEECFTTLGPYVRSCHAKDIILRKKLTVQLNEVRPGLGKLDYSKYLRLIEHLDPDMPLMLEHLKTEKEYTKAADYIRMVAKGIGIAI